MIDCLIVISCLIACAGLVSMVICGITEHEKAMIVSAFISTLAVGTMIAIGAWGC